LNADLAKLRESRLFKQLPERAFERVLQHIKVRAFLRGEDVSDLSQPKPEYRKYFGYIIRGRVVFLGEKAQPLGMAVRDEFFLGRSFSLSGRKVAKLISASDDTLLVWIPKEIIEILASNSEVFSEIIEEIYDSIFERAEMIAADTSASQYFQDWLKQDPHSDKTLSSWIGALEKKKNQARQKIERAKREKRQVRNLWIVGSLFVSLALIESLGRMLQLPIAPTYLLYHSYGRYDPGSDFNILLGFIGYGFLILTNIHTASKVLIRKFKWKINYKYSLQLHIFFGLAGAGLVILHSAFHFSGQNIAQYAMYALFIAVMSGVIGQLISMQIPKTIGGEKMKLSAMKKEQEKLLRKAELLMESTQMKTSFAILAPQEVKARDERGFWLNLILSPLLWLRSRKVKSSLLKLGMGKDAASLASQLLQEEFQIRQKLKFLEAANIIFKRWMIVHKPIGYAVYILGFLHIIFSYILAN